MARKKLNRLLSDQIEQNPNFECLHGVQIVILDGLSAHRVLEVAEREHSEMIVTLIWLQ